MITPERRETIERYIDLVNSTHALKWGELDWPAITRELFAEIDRLEATRKSQ